MPQDNRYTTDTSTSNSVHEMRERAGDQLEKVADRVESTVKAIAERGKEVGAEVQTVAGNMKTAVDTSVKDQPMATLAIAAALGFLVGAIWKS